MDGRDLFSEASSSFSPSPGPPSRLSRGTRQPAKWTGVVVEARMPILSSLRPKESPGVSLGTYSAEMASLAFAVPSIFPKTRYRSATSPLVMKILFPSTTISSPSGMKRVVMPVASDPALGSVITRAASPPPAITGRRRRFISSGPKSMRGLMA